MWATIPDTLLHERAKSRPSRACCSCPASPTQPEAPAWKALPGFHWINAPCLATDRKHSLKVRVPAPAAPSAVGGTAGRGKAVRGRAGSSGWPAGSRSIHQSRHPPRPAAPLPPAPSNTSRTWRPANRHAAGARRRPIRRQEKRGLDAPAGWQWGREEAGGQGTLGVVVPLGWAGPSPPRPAPPRPWAGGAGGAAGPPWRRRRSVRTSWCGSICSSAASPPPWSSWTLKSRRTGRRVSGWAAAASPFAGGAGRWCTPRRARSPGGPRAPLRAPGAGRGERAWRRREPSGPPRFPARAAAPAPPGRAGRRGPAGRTGGTAHPGAARPAPPPLRDARAASGEGLWPLEGSAPARLQGAVSAGLGLHPLGCLPSQGLQLRQPPRGAGRPGRPGTLRPTCDRRRALASRREERKRAADREGRKTFLCLHIFSVMGFLCSGFTAPLFSLYVFSTSCLD